MLIRKPQCLFSRVQLFLCFSSPAVEEGFLPGFEFVCTGCDCISKLYELAAERDLTKEQHEGSQPGERRGRDGGHKPTTKSVCPHPSPKQNP